MKKEPPNLDNVKQMENCSCVSIITTPINKELNRQWKDKGVGHISTRTVGFDPH